MVAVQLPFSVAVAQDVSTIAEAITVRIDGPKAGGSGVNSFKHCKKIIIHRLVKIFTHPHFPSV